ncbi:MAG TPA: DinB family protein [Terriglobia bacterium]|nr:DinB family protein [Terriglobia bacterium]
MPTRKTIAIANELVGIVETAAAKLRLLQETEVTLKTSPVKWSKKEILGHLMDSATNNHQRFIRAQMIHEFSFPGYEQDEWVRRQDYNAKAWTELIDLWRLYNRHVAHAMRNIPEDKLDTVCRIGNGDPVTLGFIAEDYVTHLKHHLAQLGVTNV